MPMAHLHMPPLQPHPRRQVLTECENEFGRLMPHSALHSVRTVEDVAAYWVHRLNADAEVQQASEQHWSRVHPSNVQVELVDGDRGRQLVADWSEKQPER